MQDETKKEKESKELSLKGGLETETALKHQVYDPGQNGINREGGQTKPRNIF